MSRSKNNKAIKDRIIVFLDVDGVLNHKNCDDFVSSKIYGIDSYNLSVFIYILNFIGKYRIVLTSTWGLGWDKEYNNCDLYAKYLIQKLSKYGIFIYDKISYKGDNRGKGINTFLKSHEGYKNYIIIDDDIFDDYYSYDDMINHLLKTDFDYGLTKEHISKVQEILR